MSHGPDLAPGSLPGSTPRYAGEPGRPDPCTTKAPRELLRDLDEARVVCLAPDVCKTPVGNTMVPVPYMIHDLLGHDAAYTPSVRATGYKVCVFRSNTQHVHGDEAGTGGGVKSGTHGGICEPIEHAKAVRAEGSQVIRHRDKFWMNNRNTIGEAQFVRNVKALEAPEDDDPLPGSARADPPVAKSRAEDEGKVVSDIRPDAGMFRPGAQLAFRDTEKFPDPEVRPAPTVPAPAPEPAPPSGTPPAQPPTTTTTEPPGNPGRWARFGKWGRYAGKILGRAARGLDLLIPDNAYNLSDVVPGDEYERQVVRDFTDAVGKGADSWDERTKAMQKIQQHRQAKRELDTKTETPQPAPEPAGTRVSNPDKEREDCGIRPHRINQSKCAATGGASHHGMVDFPFRTGTQEETIAGLDRRARLYERVDGMLVNKGPR